MVYSSTLLHETITHIRRAPVYAERSCHGKRWLLAGSLFLFVSSSVGRPGPAWDDAVGRGWQAGWQHREVGKRVDELV